MPSPTPRKPRRRKRRRLTPKPPRLLKVSIDQLIAEKIFGRTQARTIHRDLLTRGRARLPYQWGGGWLTSPLAYNSSWSMYFSDQVIHGMNDETSRAPYLRPRYVWLALARIAARSLNPGRCSAIRMPKEWFHDHHRAT